MPSTQSLANSLKTTYLETPKTLNHMVLRACMPSRDERVDGITNLCLKMQLLPGKHTFAHILQAIVNEGVITSMMTSQQASFIAFFIPGPSHAVFIHACMQSRDRRHSFPLS